MMMQDSQIEMTGPPDYNDGSVADTVNSLDDGVPLDRVEAGVSVPDAETMRASVTPYRKSGCKIYTYIIIGTVVLLSIVIGLAVGLRNGGGNASRSSTNAAVPRRANATQFTEYFATQGVSSRTAMADGTSAQGLAIEWLSERDAANLAIPTGNLIGEAGYSLLERYVLAVVYYSFNGPFWRSQSRFLDEGDVCSWGFRFFNGRDFFDFGVACTVEGGSVQRMTDLYLDANNLVGSIPTEVGALTSLEVLDLNSNNGLTGRIPTTICSLNKLRVLALGFGGLSGSIPTCIGDLQSLSVLFMSNNDLTGALPTSISTLDRLTGLFVDDNKLTGDITTAFNNMPNLTRLYLEDNEFTGTLDDKFMLGHDNVEAIDLSTNNITGTVPAHLFSLTSLIVLDLHDNQLAGGIPTAIPGNTSNLHFVALHQNNMTGPIPGSIANLEQLVHLDFSSNQHTGAIPTELGEIKDLRYLFIADNPGLTAGPVPTEFASLSQLEELSLKSTRRTGSLPTFLSNFSELILLDLDENTLAGELPVSYSNLTKLEFLLLNRNAGITGTVPTQYSAMSSLRVLLLDNTGITGSMAPFCSIASLNEQDGDGDGDELVVANCGGTNPLITDCTCCDLCCAGGEDCHDNFLVASLNPVWERGFRRTILEFGNNTRFISRDFLSNAA